MKIKIAIVMLATTFLVTSCELLNLENISTELTDGEIIDGLKTALAIGTDSASANLMKADGYFKGNISHVKIPLPEEAESIRALINSNSSLKSVSDLIGLNAAFDDVILKVNRAAEDAAKDAAPIFKDAITSLSISQGWDILHGTVPSDSELKSTGTDFDSTAATVFLKGKTYVDLTNLYAPKINVSLQKNLVGNVSAYDAWEYTTDLYNDFMDNSVVKTTLLFTDIDLPGQITTDIGVFSTEKALNGLFYKVGNEEKKIRKDPFAWAEDIIQKVFGSLLDE